MSRVQAPSLGRIVLVPVHPTRNNGAPIAPAVITRVFNEKSINVRVLTDSAESPEWRTSLELVDSLDGRETSDHVWVWPPRV